MFDQSASGGSYISVSVDSTALPLPAYSPPGDKQPTVGKHVHCVIQLRGVHRIDSAPRSGLIIAVNIRGELLPCRRIGSLNEAGTPFVAVTTI